MAILPFAMMQASESPAAKASGTDTSSRTNIMDIKIQFDEEGEEITIAQGLEQSKKLCLSVLISQTTNTSTLNRPDILLAVAQLVESIQRIQAFEENKK